jgi:protoporphyrinogen oxidase
LSLALLLDGDVVVFEADDEVGGHCRSTIRDGWTFDRGPHIMFSRDSEVLDFMIRSLQGNVHQSRRKNVVCVQGAFVKYPIENDLGSLPTEWRNRCLLDFLFNDPANIRENPTNLHEWFLDVFGAALTDLYFKPYNEKVWKVPLEDLSMSWSERIPRPPAIDVVKGALGISTEGYVHQLYFHYPLEGGYGAIPLAWSRLLRPGVLRLRSPVQRILSFPDGVKVVTPTGTEHFDRVVCTATMPRLLEMVGSPPEVVRAAVDRLQTNSIGVVTLGFRGVDTRQYTAMYMPDPDYLVNRASAPRVFSPHNGPDGCYSIQAEITAGPKDGHLGASDDSLIEHVLQGFLRYGLVNQDDPVIFADVQRIERAYVVYTVGYERHVETVRDWAASRGVHIHGRFGAFDYLNVDGCILRSLELASRLNGRPTSLSEINLGQRVGL